MAQEEAGVRVSGRAEVRVGQGTDHAIPRGRTWLPPGRSQGPLVQEACGGPRRQGSSWRTSLALPEAGRAGVCPAPGTRGAPGHPRCTRS